MTVSRILLERLPDDLRSCVQTAVPLRDWTTLRIGGPAAAVCQVRNAGQAQRFQAFCAEQDLPCFILGGGSNVLAADAGFAGVVLHIAADAYRTRGETVTVGAGLAFDDLIARSLEQGLVGLEFASGIPGTVGGALVGNAGCYGHEIGEFLEQALVLRRDGRLETVGAGEFGFTYRETRLRESGDILLEATLRLRRADTAAALAERVEHIADRRAKHPVSEPCAGSWFRNLPPEQPGGRRRAAGILLEAIGAKTMTEGDARVFPGHANIIINGGNATSAQVVRLVERLRRGVQDRFGIRLEEEVRRLGPTAGGGLT